MFQVNITEQMVNAEPQEIITNDNLNASVDAQVYFKVKGDEESVKGSLYNVNNYRMKKLLQLTLPLHVKQSLTVKSAPRSKRQKV
jgi:regulator of protease activity HflC (stomatin/prohibitin superfamily)